MLPLIVIIISIVLFIFWCVQFCSLMEMGDEEFKGKNDKLIWALAMLLANFVGAFLFMLYKIPKFDEHASENVELTEKEREILSDGTDRYKNLSEQFPQYNEYFALTAAMGKMDRENIEKRFIKHTSEKLMRMYDNGPASIAEGAYGILIAELIRREFDMSKL